jgi:hypothetical protein
MLLSWNYFTLCPSGTVYFYIHLYLTLLCVACRQKEIYLLGCSSYQLREHIPLVTHLDRYAISVFCSETSLAVFLAPTWKCWALVWALLDKKISSVSNFDLQLVFCDWNLWCFLRKWSGTCHMCWHMCCQFHIIVFSNVSGRSNYFQIKQFVRTYL